MRLGKKLYLLFEFGEKLYLLFETTCLNRDFFPHFSLGSVYYYIVSSYTAMQAVRAQASTRYARKLPAGIWESAPVVRTTPGAASTREPVPHAGREPKQSRVRTYYASSNPNTHAPTRIQHGDTHWMHEHSEQSVNIELDMSARAHLASIVDFDNERKLRARERCESGTCKRTGCAYCAAKDALASARLENSAQ